MRASHPQIRRHILDAGHALVVRRGFVAVGLSEILKAAQVPKGSFYHYFGSKEQYGRALLERYVSDYGARLDALFRDDGTCARERLLRYWHAWQTEQLDDGNGQGCLVVKLGAEVADLSDEMRVVLRDGVERLVARIAAMLEAGVHDGSLLPVADARGLAQTLYQLWLGAALVAKLRRDPGPFDHAMDVTRQMLRAP
jgi:TetR/AcrR family transcriptional repressor of nem operon